MNPHHTEEFEKVFNDVAQYTTATYGLEVLLKKIPDIPTGDFNGKQIFVDTEIDWEMRVFILGHLFGHSVQWNISEDLRQLGLTASNLNQEFTPELISKIKKYEQEASQYALQLFHEINYKELDQWLSNWVAADWNYLEEAYTKKKASGEYRSYMRKNTLLITPLQIPKFTPQLFETRQSF